MIRRTHPEGVNRACLSIMSATMGLLSNTKSDRCLNIDHFSAAHKSAYMAFAFG